MVQPKDIMVMKRTIIKAMLMDLSITGGKKGMKATELVFAAVRLCR